VYYAWDLYSNVTPIRRYKSGNTPLKTMKTFFTNISYFSPISNILGLVTAPVLSKRKNVTFASLEDVAMLNLDLIFDKNFDENPNKHSTESVQYTTLPTEYKSEVKIFDWMLLKVKKFEEKCNKK
jgi:hypothetical protein